MGLLPGACTTHALLVAIPLASSLPIRRQAIGDGLGDSGMTLMLRDDWEASGHGMAAALAQVKQGNSSARLPWTEGVLKALAPPDAPVASDIMGTSMNSAQDLNVLLSALGTNCLVLVVAAAVFSVLRLRFPLVYQRAPIDSAASMAGALVEAKTWLGWAAASYRLTMEDAEEASGLDQALLIQFTTLCMRICAVLGVPLVLVLCPLHQELGGGAAGLDRLSGIGFANVVPGHWLCWLHAVVVWLVVGKTMQMIYQAQKAFLPKRFDWLRRMPPPQSTTVLVEGIPPEHCSDAGLKAYFATMFSEEAVLEARVVRKTRGLVALLDALEALQRGLRKAEYVWEKAGRRADSRPTFLALDGKWKDEIAYYEAEIADFESRIAAERRSVEAASGGEYNEAAMASTGFVTFASARNAMLAQQLQFKEDKEELSTSRPPAPSDVLWADLQADETAKQTSALLGRAAVVGLFLGFLPIVVSISAITDLHTLKQHVGLVDWLCTSMPAIANVLDGILGSLALNICMDLLPTILMMIFHNFFHLRSEAWSQHELQLSYFWFNLIFVVLVTAVGNSLLSTASAIAKEPFKIFSLLAGSLPLSTHFYMNYLILQWAAHMMSLLRQMPLLKFLFFRVLYGEKEAKTLSEPEDQDAYGLGSRTSRFTIHMVVVLVFCSLSPVICIFGFVNFACCRLSMGYLLIFAETRKADLGGVFWVSQLQHLMYGVLVYVVLMLGVLADRGGGGPCALAVPSLALWLYGYRKFHTALCWEEIPFEDVVLKDTGSANRPISPLIASGDYRQPELCSSLKRLEGAEEAAAIAGGARAAAGAAAGPSGCTAWMGRKLPCGGGEGAGAAA